MSQQTSGLPGDPLAGNRGSRLAYLSGVLIVLAGAAAMGLSLGNNDYTGLDVKKFLVDSPFFQRMGFWKSVWLCLTKQAFPEDAYYPVFQVSLGIDLLLFRGIPLLSAALNVALHIANALLLFRLGRVFFERDARMSPEKSLAAATVAAVLFAVHPVNVEPVSWVCGRKVLLAFFFSALSLLFLLKETVKARDVVLAGFFYLLAACSNALVLGVPMAVYAYFFMIRRLSWAGAARRTAPLLVVLLITGALRSIQNKEELSAYGEKMVFSRMAGSTLRGQFEQVLSLVYPSGLSHLYGHEIPQPPFWTTGSYLGIVLILVSAVLIAALWKRKSPAARAVNFCMVAYWLVLAPTFMHHFARADRHLYIPLVPLSFLIGMGFVAAIFLFRSRFAVWAAGSALLFGAALPLVLVSRAQARIWQDNVVLFEHAVRVAPENAKALSNLALHLMARGHLERPKQLYHKVIEISPAASDTYLNLALIYEGEGNLDKAIEHYRKGLRLDNKDAKAHSFLAVALDKKGLHEEALQHFQMDLKLAPHLARPYVNMGLIAGRLHDLPAATAFFNRALKIEPKSDEIHYNFAVTLESNGDEENAVRHYAQALKLNPGHALAHNNLGAIYAQHGQAGQAAEHFEKAIALDPSLIRTRANLAFMLLNQGRTDEAILRLREVLQEAREIHDPVLEQEAKTRLEALGALPGEPQP